MNQQNNDFECDDGLDIEKESEDIHEGGQESEVENSDDDELYEGGKEESEVEDSGDSN